MAVRKRTISVMLTSRCNIRCKHCIMNAEARGATIDPVDLASWLEQCAEARFEQVCFTGGESFLVPHLLRQATAECERLGMQASVVTNGYWARSPAEADRALAAAGPLQLLAVSWDRFHEEFLPRERAVWAAEAAKRAGIQTAVVGTYLIGESDIPVLGVDGVPEATQPVVRAGRASEFVRPDQVPPADCRSRCGEIGEPLLAPDGTVYACCGASYHALPESHMIMGSLRDETLPRVMSRGWRDPVLQAMRAYGPYWLARRLEERGCAVPVDTSHMCTVCLSLFSHPEAVAELRRMAGDAVFQRQVQARRFILFQELPDEGVVV